MTNKPDLHAVIGAWAQGARTFYVRRSEKMENYPDAWSLLSIQFDPLELRDHVDIEAVQRLMDRMAEERLCGATVTVRNSLSSARCSDNPIGVRVHLYLYEVDLEREPTLNEDFYTDGRWMTPEEYSAASANETCGTCMRMWSDYCVRAGLCETRFAPELVEDDD